MKTLAQIGNGIRIAGLILATLACIALSFDNGEHVIQLQVGCLAVILILKREN